MSQHRLRRIIGHLSQATPPAQLPELGSDIPCECRGITTLACTGGISDAGRSTVKPSPRPVELDIERAKASFDVRELTHILNGSEDITLFKEVAAQVIQADPILFTPDQYDLPRADARVRVMRKVRRLRELHARSTAGGGADGTDDAGQHEGANKGSMLGVYKDGGAHGMQKAFWGVLGSHDQSFATRVGVHVGLFASAIASSGTREQIEVYRKDIDSFRIFGCFAMTELGHGSFVRGIETTATYDHATDEFVINTPSVTATKWWIGMAGQTATHSVVFAQLIIDGVHHGVHSFVVQIRNTSDHLPRPGVAVGDCGSKMGRNGLDNGWIQFSNVRVPRTAMLMRWASVDNRGVYSKSPSPQLEYGALIGGRVSITSDCADKASQALTIAIRYGCVRRQFADVPGDKEVALMDYQTHQYRLLPHLAAAYAFHFTAGQLDADYHDLLAKLRTKELDNLGDVHALSAGLKAYATWWAYGAIEECRQSCGGHGYSMYSGLPGLLADFAVNMTWEGDNTVLAQQTARYLISSLAHARNGDKLHGFTAYLHDVNITTSSRCQATSGADFVQSRYHLDAWKAAATARLIAVDRRLHHARSQMPERDAWNSCQADLVAAARTHVYYYTASRFEVAVNAITDSAIRDVLRQVSSLFSLSYLSKHEGATLVASRYFSPDHARLVDDAIRTVTTAVRPQAIPLVDAFNHPDFILSPLGRYDGDVYNAYFETVKGANAQGVAPYFEDEIRPLLHAGPRHWP